MKHPFWYLGFLSFLGFLGLKSPGFYGFFGFVGYFNIYKVSDERLEHIVGKSTLNGFMWTTFVGSALLIYMVFSRNVDFFPLAFVILFSGTIMFTLFSLFYFEYIKK